MIQLRIDKIFPAFQVYFPDYSISGLIIKPDKITDFLSKFLQISHFPEYYTGVCNKCNSNVGSNRQELLKLMPNFFKM